MPKDRTGIRGSVCVQVFGPDGKLKKRELSFGQAIKIIKQYLNQKKISFKEMIKMMSYEYSINHNLVTDEGDALLVDMLVTTGTQSAMNNANAEMGVGDGYAGVAKSTDALVNIIDVEQGMEATYPKQKGAFGAANDNVVQYRTIFAAGEATGSGLDETLLGNGTDTLAYAEITPVVNKGAADTLQVDWEITLLGA